jgi:amidase
MSPLEIGGDYAGSIRLPASFCGLFGHKTSETAAPRTGHFPGGKLPNAAFAMAVQGPLARSATDLNLVFDLMTGAQVGEEVAWKLDPPAPRAESLADLRVALLPRPDWLPLDDEIASRMDEVAARLSKRGVRVAAADPLEGDLRELFKTFLRVLFAQSSAEVSREEAEGIATALRGSGNEFLAASADGWLASVGDYLTWFWMREVYRERLRAFFRDWDVLLAPCTMLNAFPHTEWDNSGDAGRSLPVNGVQTSTIYMFFYPSLCNLTGHPGTAFPVGRTADGLPVGLQAIGPYLEDHTTLRFAGLFEREFGGFMPPPAFVE